MPSHFNPGGELDFDAWFLFAVAEGLSDVPNIYLIAVPAIPTVAGIAFNIGMHKQLYTGNVILALAVMLISAVAWVAAIVEIVSGTSHQSTKLIALISLIMLGVCLALAMVSRTYTYYRSHNPKRTP